MATPQLGLPVVKESRTRPVAIGALPTTCTLQQKMGAKCENLLALRPESLRTSFGLPMKEFCGWASQLSLPKTPFGRFPAMESIRILCVSFRKLVAVSLE